jgi:hypothetical protein
MATTRTRKTTQAQPETAKPVAKKTAARKTTRKPPAKKTLPKRDTDWMSDGQGFAIVAALIAGIPTARIQDWTDHGDGTVTRALSDGTLQYTVATRTLRWQATCRMGAVHSFRIDDASMAAAARVRAATCSLIHADLSSIEPLTKDEQAELGIRLHTGVTLAKQPPGEDPITETVRIPVPVKDRALGDTLTRATTATDDTQPLPAAEIAAGLAARADTEEAKEHPEP